MIARFKFLAFGLLCGFAVTGYSAKRSAKKCAKLVQTAVGNSDWRKDINSLLLNPDYDVAKEGRAIRRFITKHNLDGNQRAQLAHFYAFEDARHGGYFIDAFDLSAEQKWKLILDDLTHDGGLAHLNKFKLTKERRKELLAYVIKHNPDQAISYLDRFHVPPADSFNILLRVMKNPDFTFFQGLNKFADLNAQERFALASAAASKTKWVFKFIKDLQYFKLSSVEEQFSVIKTLVLRRAAETANHLISDSTATNNLWHSFTNKQRLELADIMVQKDFDVFYSYVAHSGDFAIQAKRNLQKKFILRYGIRALKRIAEIAPDPENDVPWQPQEINAQLQLADLNDLAAILWTPVARTEVGNQLIMAMGKVIANEPSYTVPSTSLHLLAKSLGVDYQSLASSELMQRATSRDDFFDAALRIISVSKYQPFGKISFSPQLLEKQHMRGTLDFLSKLKSYLLLATRKSHSKELNVSLLLKKLGITSLDPANIKTATPALNSLIEVRLQKLFHTKTLSAEKFFTLESSWGSLDPIITLIARFNGEETSWKSEIPYFAEMFSHILDGTFEDFKLFGSKKNEDDAELARSHLGMLDSENDGASIARKRLWLKPRSRVKLSKESNAVDISAQIQIAIQQATQLQVQLKRNFSNTTQIVGTLPNAKTFNGLIPSIEGFKPNYEELWKSIVQTASAQEATISLKDLLISLITQPGLPESSRYHYIKIAQIKSRNLEFSAQTIADLKSLESVQKTVAFGPQSMPTSAEEITFTTTTSHPKTLITIGGMVKVASCQHHEYGSMADTLLGYVGDGNVQAILSFGIRSVDFANPEDHSKIVVALRDPQTKVEGFFEGGQQLVRFKITQANQSISEVSTLFLDQAYLRRILKLGYGQNSQPGLVAEPAYQQTHPSAQLMKEQVDSIIEELKSDLGAVSTGNIWYPESRNPRKIYSDIAGGRQTDDYTINAGDSENARASESD